VLETREKGGQETFGEWLANTHKDIYNNNNENNNNTVLQTLELNWIASEVLLMFLTDCFGGAQDKNKIQDETKLNTEMRAP